MLPGRPVLPAWKALVWLCLVHVRILAECCIVGIIIMMMPVESIIIQY
jgi:hypothetical protein